MDGDVETGRAGSSLEDFLKDQENFAETVERALERVKAYQNTSPEKDPKNSKKALKKAFLAKDGQSSASPTNPQVGRSLLKGRRKFLG